LGIVVALSMWVVSWRLVSACGLKFEGPIQMFRLSQ